MSPKELDVIASREVESQVIVAPETRDLTTLAASLTRWLAERLPKGEDLEVQSLAYPSGAGQSHETVLFDISWRSGGCSCGSIGS